jgi:hypothetical protein
MKILKCILQTKLFSITNVIPMRTISFFFLLSLYCIKIVANDNSKMHTIDKVIFNNECDPNENNQLFLSSSTLTVLTESSRRSVCSS